MTVGDAASVRLRIIGNLHTDITISQYLLVDAAHVAGRRDGQALRLRRRRLAHANIDGGRGRGVGNVLDGGREKVARHRHSKCSLEGRQYPGVAGQVLRC